MTWNMSIGRLKSGEYVVFEGEGKWTVGQNRQGGAKGRGAKRTAVTKMSVTHDALNFIIRPRYIYYIFGISIYIMCRHVSMFLDCAYAQAQLKLFFNKRVRSPPWF